MQKMFMHRPFMRPKVRHLDIYEKNTNYISCHVHLKVSFVVRTAFLLGESRKYVDSQREFDKNSIPESLLVNLHGQIFITTHHCKKRLAVFPSPAGMSLTKLSLDGNDLFFPGPDSLVSDIPAEDRKMANLFYSDLTTARQFGKHSYSICST